MIWCYYLSKIKIGLLIKVNGCASVKIPHRLESAIHCKLVNVQELINKPVSQAEKCTGRLFSAGTYGSVGTRY